MGENSEMTDPQGTHDSCIADLVQAGRIRVALYPPPCANDPATGEFRGWTIQLGRARAERVGIEFLQVQRKGVRNLFENLMRLNGDK
jgi:hypothetical protein